MAAAISSALRGYGDPQPGDERWLVVGTFHHRVEVFRHLAKAGFVDLEPAIALVPDCLAVSGEEVSRRDVADRPPAGRPCDCNVLARISLDQD